MSYAKGSDVVRFQGNLPSYLSAVPEPGSRPGDVHMCSHPDDIAEPGMSVIWPVSRQGTALVCITYAFHLVNKAVILSSLPPPFFWVSKQLAES